MGHAGSVRDQCSGTHCNTFLKSSCVDYPRLICLYLGEGARAVCACLVEWPQYCNHILQISQFTCNPFTFIERALATISSRHSESNGGIIDPMDQHQGPNPVPFKNMEAPSIYSPVRDEEPMAADPLGFHEQQILTAITNTFQHCSLLKYIGFGYDFITNLFP
ncbi:uncharacterized protein LOC113355918 isoform X1 [Papaver somniferum]|uniref:uncharacterized protein LOC113355918 isoform X1 n=1 Tax=Papaver somniferum TaxID=3469 RepID=UPI000E6F9A9E|nr:uncharacterized protein LOC113355918 isoform X1 [Papaver somniferum]